MNSQKKNENVDTREENGVWRIHQRDTLQEVISIKVEETNAHAMGAESECETILWTSKFDHQCWVTLNKLLSNSGPHMYRLQQE